MSKQNLFFIGLATFEELLAQSPNKKLYLMPTNVTNPGMYTGIEIVDWYVNAACIGAGVCHYWRKRIGAYTLVHGTPAAVNKSIGSNYEAVAGSLAEKLAEIAGEYDFSVTRALVAFPTDLVYLHGTTRLVEYRAESKSFERAGGKIGQKAA